MRGGGGPLRARKRTRMGRDEEVVKDAFRDLGYLLLFHPERSTRQILPNIPTIISHTTSYLSPSVPYLPEIPQHFDFTLVDNPTNATSLTPSANHRTSSHDNLFHPDCTHRPFPLTTSALFVPYDQTCHRTCLCALILLPLPRALLNRLLHMLFFCIYVAGSSTVSD
jgi:hypothetical protein